MNLEPFIDRVEHLLRPKSWPRKYRRLFVLASPISVPLYLVVWCIAVTSISLLVCVAYPLSLLTEIWEGDIEQQVKERNETKEQAK